ncbi:MAG: acylphosphatase [Chloroflexota bacterium]|nr:acylphosphatase [Chloroflexota bacterium]
MDDDMACIHAIVEGRVQGVNFRVFVRNHAQSLGITGWVRNLTGFKEVEVWAEGKKGCLDQLVEQIQQGPRLAKVNHMQLEWGNYQGTYDDFQIKRG